MGFSDPGHRLKLDKRVVKEIVRSYTYVCIWMAISIAVIMFNKVITAAQLLPAVKHPQSSVNTLPSSFLQWLLAYSGFPFPIALTLWHMSFCSVVGFMAVRVLKVVTSHNLSLKEYMSRVMPIGKSALDT